MLRIATFFILSLATCGPRAVVEVADPSCALTSWPPLPSLDGVCTDVQATKDLGLWVRDIERIHQDLKHCKTITWNAP